MNPSSPIQSSPAALIRPEDGRRVALISAQWHADIVSRAAESFLRELADRGVASGAVDQLQVPGAFEIPLLARKLARTGRYAAIVACALVVDGGIYRHEFVANAVIGGLMRVQLDMDLPVLSVVLTPQQFHEHEVHRGFFLEHMAVKGREAAQACLATVGNLAGLAA